MKLAPGAAFVLLTALAGCDRGAGEGPAGNRQAAAEPRTVDIPQTVSAVAPGTTPMAERVAVLGLLNKRNGISRSLTLKPGQAVRVGDAVVRLRACETSAPWEVQTLTGAFVQLDVRNPQGRWQRVFSGWLYKETPSLNVVEHPIYDVWPKSCAMTHPEAGPSTVRAASAASRRSRAPSRARKRRRRRAPRPTARDRPTGKGPRHGGIAWITADSIYLRRPVWYLQPGEWSLAWIGAMRTPQVEIDAQGFADGLFLVIRELYIEIFAVVVPGICFFILVVPAIVIPAVDLLGAFVAPNYTVALFAALQTYVGIAFFAVLVMSYVIGQMLFRCDPKYPDIASIKRRPKDEIDGSCVGEYTTSETGQFPYASLQDYLKRRNFGHLAKYVTWSRKDFEQNNKRWKHRSKHLINKLKLSIKLHHPRIYFEISRNETHVRLMSSLWYLMKTVIWLASAGSVAGLLSIAWHSGMLSGTAAAWDWSGWSLHAEAFLYPAATLLLAFGLKRKIERYFHYQRVREIVYVLEAWHLIDPERQSRARPPAEAREPPPIGTAPEAA